VAAADAAEAAVGAVVRERTATPIRRVAPGGAAALLLALAPAAIRRLALGGAAALLLALAPAAIRRLALGGAAALLLVLVAPATPAAATTPRASLTAVESQVMCVACRESLAVAHSPQANAERSFIRTLIAQGYTDRQIVEQLAAQYGPAVLAKPPARGFNLTVYILPPAILLAGLAGLAVALPRWRRRTRAAAGGPAALGPPLDAGDARRLEEDLNRYA